MTPDDNGVRDTRYANFIDLYIYIVYIDDTLCKWYETRYDYFSRKAISNST